MGGGGGGGGVEPEKLFEPRGGEKKFFVGLLGWSGGMLPRKF